MTLLAAAFLVSPLAATVVLVFGILLQSALRPFNTWGRKASVHLSEDSHTMTTLVTKYTSLTGEFRLFGVEHEATAELHRSNEIAVKVGWEAGEVANRRRNRAQVPRFPEGRTESAAIERSFSSSPPSNRACRSPAHGSPTPFTDGVRRQEPARQSSAWVGRRVH